ncbi:MAG: hypothetical protein OEZ58_02420 [Gammaproteobacteria bacterium]|nr:hypothetical protein [Gammaproteobacteria bacterium]MDH5727816.1 hypothetical protein [Gammaproteobacteria bacterium]
MKRRGFLNKHSVGMAAASALFAIANVGSVQASTANPALVSNCHPGVQVTVPANGSTYHYSEDCNTGYVAPPTIGTASLSSYISNNNVNFCSNLETAKNQESVLLTAVARYETRLAALTDEFDLIDIQGLTQAKDEAEAALYQAEDDLLTAQTMYDELLEAYQTARFEYVQCAEDPLKDPLLDCDGERTAYLDARDEFNIHRTSVYYPARTNVNARRADLTRAELALTRADRSLASITTTYDSILSAAETLRDRAAQVYDDYAVINGAAASMIYTTEWTKLVNDFVVANPGLAVNWKRIPLTGARIMAAVNDSFSGNIVSGSHNIPVILSATVPGFFEYGVHKFPDGTAPTPNPENATPSTVIPDTFSSGITLSLLGACPIEADPSKKTDLDAYLIVDLDTDFELLAHASYTASYNLYTFWQRIESVRKKRRFFHSSSVRSLVENRWASERWTFNFTGDVGLIGNTPAEQADGILALEEAVRKRLYVHVLDNVGIRTSVGVDRPASPVVPPSSVGAFAAALRKTCVGGYGYLCWGGWIIGGIDSIYGGGAAINNFRQSNNSTAVDNVSFDIFVPTGTRTTFKKDTL